jgi:hypothetical protein
MGLGALICRERGAADRDWGESMGIEDLIQARPDGDNPGSIRLDQPIEFWGPPLAPAASPGSGDTLAEEEEDPGSAKSHERRLQPAKKNYFAAAATSLQQPHQMLIAATVILAALGMAALAYMWSAAGEKVAAQSQQSGGAVQSVQSAPEASPQRASAKSVSSADPSVAVAWPDLPASLTNETPVVGSSAAHANAALHETVSSTPNEDIVFLQRPGVHIRSAPSTNGRVLATAPKGTRFKVTNREGDWVQVESDRFSGWIRSRFLAANEP